MSLAAPFIAFAAAAALLGAGSAAAQTASPPASPPAVTDPAPLDPARMAVARELVVASVPAEAFMRLFLEGAEPIMRAELAQDENFRPEWREPFMEAFREEVQANMPMLQDMIAEGYARVLTLQELRDVLAFYRTPSGRALAARQGELQTTLQTAGEQMGLRIMPGVMARFARKLGVTPAPTPGINQT